MVNLSICINPLEQLFNLQQNKENISNFERVTFYYVMENGRSMSENSWERAMFTAV